MSERQQTRALLTAPWPGNHLEGGDLQQAFDQFLQLDVPDWQREERGLDWVFRAIFPIRDFSESAELQYVSYSFQEPRLTPAQCRLRGETYSRPWRVTLRMVVYDRDGSPWPAPGATLSIRDIKEQEVHLGELPWLTPEGTFVINGVDRVLSRQITEAPGVRFLPDKQGRFYAQIRPRWGTRLTFERDRRGRLQVRINQGKKRLLVTTLLRALGMNTEEILARLCPVETFRVGPRGELSLRFDPALLLGRRATRDIVIEGEVIVRKHRKILRTTIRRLRELKVEWIPVDRDALEWRSYARDVVDPSSGEVLREATEPLSPGDPERFLRAGISEFFLLIADGLSGSDLPLVTLRADTVQTREEALMAIYRLLRPGDAPTVETAEYLLQNLLFSERRFFLSRPGRHLLNRKLYPDDPEPPLSMALTVEDIVRTLQELFRRDLRQTRLGFDDTEHISEAVVRDQGELIGDAIYAGLLRMERAIKERMSMSQDIDTLMPHDLVNGRPLQHALADFFGHARVSERADTKHPAAEFSQRRRLASSEVSPTARRSSYRFRGRHDSHLGVFCPVERPPSGLPLALGCSVDALGFLRAPSDPLADPDAGPSPPAPWQLVGPLAALLPFLQHNAPEAASRGVENLRISVPPLRSTAPLVATGLEAEVAHASGLSLKAPGDGEVLGVTPEAISLRMADGELRSLSLRHFEIDPWGAVVLQRAVVRPGQRVHAGELLATGLGVASGEVATGHDLLVALVSGPTFGESLVVSEAVVQRGLFASIRLREYRILLGGVGDEEQFTAEVPGLDEEERASLEQDGLVRVGQRVRAGDVLVGRIRRRTGLSEEEVEVEDTSLRLPAGREGVVVRCRIARKREAVLPRKAQAIARVTVAEPRPLEVGDLLGSRHGDRGTVARIAPVEDMPTLPDGTPVELLMNPAYVLEFGAAGLLMELLAGGPGVPVLVPPFGDAPEALLRARFPGSSVVLRDGATGEPHQAPVSAGRLYMMRLPPLAGDTLEARSTGPTDPISGLPVEGRGVAPGQLFDEDGSTALLALGAAYTLQEMLATKGDAEDARAAVPAMLREHPEHREHVPRGLEALVRELRAAALDVQGLAPEDLPAPSLPAEAPPSAPSRGKKGRGKKK